jgi:hypothetical protein
MRSNVGDDWTLAVSGSQQLQSCLRVPFFLAGEKSPVKLQI